ncbi:unnamed protein product [Gadus morhua 'NCC']
MRGDRREMIESRRHAVSQYERPRRHARRRPGGQSVRRARSAACPSRELPPNKSPSWSLKSRENRSSVLRGARASVSGTERHARALPDALAADPPQCLRKRLGVAFSSDGRPRCRASVFYRVEEDGSNATTHKDVGGEFGFASATTGRLSRLSVAPLRVQWPIAVSTGCRALLSTQLMVDNSFPSAIRNRATLDTRHRDQKTPQQLTDSPPAAPCVPEQVCLCPPLRLCASALSAPRASRPVCPSAPLPSAPRRPVGGSNGADDLLAEVEVEVEGVEVQSDLLAEVEVEVQGVEVQSDLLAEVEVEVEGLEVLLVEVEVVEVLLVEQSYDRTASRTGWTGGPSRTPLSGVVLCVLTPTGGSQTG